MSFVETPKLKDEGFMPDDAISVKYNDNERGSYHGIWKVAGDAPEWVNAGHVYECIYEIENSIGWTSELLMIVDDCETEVIGKIEEVLEKYPEWFI